MQSRSIQLSAEWDGDRGTGDPGPGKPALVLLHGFTGNRGSWNPVLEGLRQIGPVLAVDLIGHGQSPKPVDPDHYQMDSCLEQLETLLKKYEIPACWWIGYSMGGRVALQMAVHKPHLVQGLLLESTTAGLSDGSLREKRKQADEGLAEKIITNGISEFMESWLASPLFDGLKRLPPEQLKIQRDQRLRNDPVGLANSLRGMGTGQMEPVWEFLPEMEFPVLVITGGEDEKFSAIGKEMTRKLPLAKLATVKGAGHIPHVENPENFISEVSGFFNNL